MNIICVDDEPYAVEYTVRQCRQLPQAEEVRGFVHTREALDYARDHPVDLAILDINMPETDGIALAIQIKQLRPQAAVLFLTAYREYAFDAYSAHPSGYLLKPVSQEELAKEIRQIFAEEKPVPASHIQVKTFGEFDLLVDGKNVVFARAKSKELLAYLVDRQGGTVTRNAAFAVLFEDEPYTRARQKYMDVIIRSMRQTLDTIGAGEILEMNRSGLRIRPEKMDCDVYRFFSGDERTIKSFQGEYMSAYSWASIKEAYLDQMAKKLGATL